MPYPWECCDCKLLDTSDSKWGEYYCNYYHRYVRADSSSCDHIVKKNGGSNCYLTTAICNILNYEDDCYILENLRGFRDNYMKKEESCKGLLTDYDEIGPEISKCIKDDENNIMIASIMLNKYIYPAITSIDNNMYDDAIEIYKDMTLNLMKYYGIDADRLSFNKELGPNIVRTREKETE